MIINLSFKKNSTLLMLLIGDVIALLLSLWLSLLFRKLELPNYQAFMMHLYPFCILFFIWILVFFITGLYEKSIVISYSYLAFDLAKVSCINIFIAIIFFYFIAYFGIAPKSFLLIYCIISFCALFIWRSYFFIGRNSYKKQKAIIIGRGSELKEIYNKISGKNQLFYLKIINTIDLDQVFDECDIPIDSQQPQQSYEGLASKIQAIIHNQYITTVILDLNNDIINHILPYLYNFNTQQVNLQTVNFINIHDIYEDLFKKIPINLINYGWLIHNIAFLPHATYDGLKRMIDIFISCILLIFTTIFVFPVVYLLIKLEDKGKIFVVQQRIGQYNKMITLYKFRSMSFNDNGKQNIVGQNKITQVGKIIRKTRIDELPQLWNVLKGDLSLIGPRPELPSIASEYEQKVNYYNIRHIVKPGLSGWAQIYHKTPPKVLVDIHETRVKLSYDLYYIKHRSILLDIRIIAKTILVLLAGSGS